MNIHYAGTVVIIRRVDSNRRADYAKLGWGKRRRHFVFFCGEERKEEEKREQERKGERERDKQQTFASLPQVEQLPPATR